MLQKYNTYRIVTIFFEQPTRAFQLRELARVSKLSTTAVKSALLDLIKENLITKRTVKKYHFYEANRGDKNYKFFKKFHNLELLKNSGLIKYIEKKLNYPEAIVLFGSAARGEDVERSDIDLFILTTVKKELSLDKFEKKLKRPIKTIIMDKKDFDLAKKKNPELINNVINGLVVSGYLSVL